MDFSLRYCVSRAVVAAGVAVVLLFIATIQYPIPFNDALIILGLFAVAAYGLIPGYVANVTFCLMAIALVCVLAFVAPLPTLAVCGVLITLFVMYNK